VAVAALVATAACVQSDAAVESSHPSIRIVAASATAPARVEVGGLSAAVLEDIRRNRLTGDRGAALLRVSVADAAPAILGSYDVAGGALRFTPAFPFDPGREYSVRFDPSGIDGMSGHSPVNADVALPGRDLAPSTLVSQVYPSGDVVPENLLRLYIEFSAPMARGSGIEHVELLDDSGRRVEAPFLPLDYEFWSPDHRRFTVFFDPGRVKDGILPNQQMGRPLEAGRSYTLVIRREWRDGNGLPLAQEFRRVWRVGPARTEALDTSTWRVTSPQAGRRAPLVVSFDHPLDRALLMRGLGVRLNGAPVAGEIHVDPGERRWTFTPDQPWRTGTHHLLALSFLEDVAGNQIGRAFEVDNFDTADKGPDPKTVLVPFAIPAAPSS
jgi:hypothetical protein